MSAKVWGIHGGSTGDADTLFTAGNVVALGWSELGDLSTLSPEREAFKSAVAKAYPAAKPGAIPNYAGQLFRFVHEAKEGDWVVYPSKLQRRVFVGRIAGPYSYRPDPSSTYPNHRSANWLGQFPRTRFSQGALYEIGSAMSFFQVRNYADEFLAAAEGKKPPEAIQTVDTTATVVVEQTEENTRDFIISRLAKELKGHPFAGFIAQLLQAMGYRTRVSPTGPDGGIDIVAHRDELGFEPPLVKVQVKSTEGTIGDPEVSALAGKVGKDEFGLIVTLGTFSPQARAFVAARSNLRLIDGATLIDLVFSHYEALDPKYKAVIPLRRVYVPAPPDDPAA